MVRVSPLSCLFLLLNIPISSAESFGYGDTVGGLPSWRERSVIVLTNACRMAPTTYRDKYVGNYTILLPANYPATYPLYWNQYLNQSAHVHAIDMANNCGMQHPSCDGTAWDTRIKSYYKASSWIGENISTGSADAVAALKQWIMDGSTPAVDKSGSDGHRSNIMSNNYKEMGTGYAYGSIQYRYFWVQDFGGGTPTFTNKIYAGSHFFIKTDTTSFMANYYDAANQAPSEASIYVDGQKFTMAVDAGANAQGTYKLNLKKAAVCRQYYFSFTGGNGASYRYPEQGYLVTAGEGTCTMEYSPTLGTMLSGLINPSADSHLPQLKMAGGEMVLIINARAVLPDETALYQVNGKQLWSNRWPQNQKGNTGKSESIIMKTLLPDDLRSGYYIVSNRFAGEGWFSQSCFYQR